jgi:hypothetical protein
MHVTEKDYEVFHLCEKQICADRAARDSADKDSLVPAKHLAGPGYLDLAFQRYHEITFS